MLIPKLFTMPRPLMSIFEVATGDRNRHFLWRHYFRRIDLEPPSRA
jgi:hypothetical protein